MIMISLQCPNCGQLMDLKGFSGEDSFEDYSYFKCSDCGIEYFHENWSIPKKYSRPTEKQLACISIINRRLNMNFVPVLRKQATYFISQHIQESKASTHSSYECDDIDDEIDMAFHSLD